MPGRIELLNIDCMEYMATLPDGAFDLAIVDPPYGRGEDGGTNRCHGVKQKNGTVLRCMDGGYAKKDWDREPPPPEYFDELRRVARHQIVWGANYMPVKLQGCAIVWDKVNDGADQSGAPEARGQQIVADAIVIGTHRLAPQERRSLDPDRAFVPAWMKCLRHARDSRKVCGR